MLLLQNLPSLIGLLKSISSLFGEEFEAGQQVDHESFVAEYPQFADELCGFFESAEIVKRMAGPTLGSTVKNADKSVETHVTGVGDSISDRPSATSQQAETESLPETFGRYRIEKQLARGAMGAVYLAKDTQLDRHIALKTPTFDTTADAELVERFYRELRAAAIIGQKMTQDAPPPSQFRAEVDAELDAICKQMMARQAGDRYATFKPTWHVSEDKILRTSVSPSKKNKSRKQKDMPCEKWDRYAL